MHFADLHPDLIRTINHYRYLTFTICYKKEMIDVPKEYKFSKQY